MEIIYYPEGDQPSVSLTGESPEEGMQTGNVVQANVLDIVPLIRSLQPKISSLGNQTNTFAFTIQRTHSTPGAAAFYWLHHLTQLNPPVGRVRFTAQEPGGDLVARLWMERAGIQGRQGTFEGCCTTFEYTIIGGILLPEQF